MKNILLNYNLNQVKTLLADYGFLPYQAEQVYVWLAKGYNFDEMSNLSKDKRALLNQHFYAQGSTIAQQFTSADGSQKFLFNLFDGNIVEGVLMSYKYGNTLCVSTQVGCAMGCTFCASTLGGLIRNLTAGEILSQVTTVNRYLGGTLDERKITNVVLMGSGEPLSNYDNVVAFLYLLNQKEGLNISMRNISLSTCGIVPRIYQLADLNLGVNLTVSLHSADQKEREALMPIAKTYALAQLIEAARYYFTKTGRRVIFEYTLISGSNDSVQDAKRLATLLKSFPAHVNLIRLNPVAERDKRATSTQDALAFCGLLEKLGVSATLRRQLGVDIGGACGQLRAKYLHSQTDSNGVS